MSNNLSNIRIAAATSSTIKPIISKGAGADSIGAPFFTYLEKKRAERFFKGTVEAPADAFPLQWGKLCELFVHKKRLGMDYIFQSETSLQHERFPGWVGTPDGGKKKTVLEEIKWELITDMKCPITKMSFMAMIYEMYDFDGFDAKKLDKFDGTEAITYMRENHDKGEDYYWQLISNACIFKTGKAQLIAFMPHYETLQEILDFNAALNDPFDMVQFKKFEHLPFIPKECGVEEVNIIEFEVPVEDKRLLEDRFKIFWELLNLTKSEYEDFLSKRKTDFKTETQIKAYTDKLATA